MAAETNMQRLKHPVRIGRPARHVLLNYRLFVFALLCLMFSQPAFATWSIIALDARSGEIVMASATCLRQRVFPSLGARDLRDIQAVVVPGKGAAMLQSYIDETRANQRLVHRELEKGTAPGDILELLKAEDAAVETRQFGILDFQGRRIGFTGESALGFALSRSGRVGESIYYQFQGNILASEAVAEEAVGAFQNTATSLGDRVMASMEAADAAGGDRRCTGGKTADVAYIWIVDGGGKDVAYISVTDENIQQSEDRNPVATLRLRYDRR